MTRFKLYHEYAPWFTMLTPPEEYEIEVAHFAQGFEDAAQRPVRDVLVLGSGAGNTASHLKDRYNLVLTDVSEEMLEVSRAQNPGCEHLIGDMRTMRLTRKFDAVLVEDAIMYMTSEEELAAVFATARVHLRPGGGATFAPDAVTETYKPFMESGGNDSGARGMRYMMWQLPARRGTTKQEVVFTYMFREPRKPVRVDHEIHEFGLFPRGTWEHLIRESGLAFDEHWQTPEGGVVFTAHEPRKAGSAREPRKAGRAHTSQARNSTLRVCSRCATMREGPDDVVPLGWSVDFAGGRVAYLCENCARANVRAIEGRLPEEYWE